MLKIVKDTGCVNAKLKIDVLNLIEDFEKQGKLEIIMITTSRKEWGNYKIGYKKYLVTKKEGEYGRFDESTFDECVYTNQLVKDRSNILSMKLFHKPFNTILKNPRLNSIRDIMILNRAIGIKADYFLTVDKNFVKNGRADWFEKQFNIKIRYVDKHKNDKLINEIKASIQKYISI